MNTPSSTIVQRIWNYCTVLRDARRLSVVGEAESAVEAGLVRAGRLRQAVPCGMICFGPRSRGGCDPLPVLPPNQSADLGEGEQRV